MISSPIKLGLNHPSWRPHQIDAVKRQLFTDRRFLALVAPTGFGKTVAYLSAPLFAGERVCAVVATKALQDQLAHELQSLGADVRGQRNYDCAIAPVKVDQGPCHLGQECTLKNGGCSYFDAFTRARRSKVVVTNYSMWLALAQQGEGLGAFDRLVLDEAHLADQELSAAVSVEITSHDLKLIDRSAPPPSGWGSWARECLDQCDSLFLSGVGTDKQRLRLKDLKRRLNRLCTIPGKGWLMEETAGTRSRPQTWAWNPVTPAPFSDLLFRDIPKIVLVSATIRRKTLDLLGIPEKDSEVVEYPSSFPVERRPVIHIKSEPPLRMTFRSTDTDLKRWVNLIDQIIARRLDRKGVIHTVSYARQQFLLQHTRYAARMLAPRPGELSSALAAFREEDHPRTILVSPSVTTGVDFPYSAAEYQIITKLPFPDLRSKVLRARAKLDPDYGMYICMQTVVQASGRGMRAADDRCETIIVDNQWAWLRWKYAAYAPEWFLEACKDVNTVPDPPEKL